MKVEDQEKTKQQQYVRAMRYFDNAKKVLSNSGIEGIFYKDEKYVSSACGIAYKGVLVALDCWLTLKEVKFPKEEKKRKSIEFYMYNLQKHNKKMVDYLNSAYRALHLDGYYGSLTDSRIIKAGFASAKELIDLIKPSAQEAL